MSPKPDAALQGSARYTFGEGTSILYPDGRTSALPEHALTHSRLLKDLQDVGGLIGQAAPINLTFEQLETWLDYINPFNGAHKFSGDDDLVTILQAADVLIDEATLRIVISLLAKEMFESGFDAACEKPSLDSLSNTRMRMDADVSPGSLQLMPNRRVLKVVDCLSSDIAMEILRATNVNLPDLLYHLPSSLHPVVVRTHIPSVDLHHSLHIELHHSPPVAVAIAQAAASLAHLSNLSFHQSLFPAEAMSPLFSSLCAMTSLKSIALDLSNSAIDYERACELVPVMKCAPFLEALAINNCKLGNDSVSVISHHLVSLERLLHLSLSGNGMGDEGVALLSASLAEMPQLQQLDISHNSMTCNSASLLAQSLSCLTNLQLLSVKGNRLGSQGACTLFPSVKQLLSLTDLNVEDISAADSGISTLSLQFYEMQASIRTLHLGHNRIGVGGCEALSCVLPTLVSLQVCHNVSMVERGRFVLQLSLLCECQSGFQEICLRANDIGDDGIAALIPSLSHLSSLVSLSLRQNLISTEGIEVISVYLPSLSGLKVLDLSLNDVGDSGAMALALSLRQLPCLTTVRLMRCRIYVVGARALADSLHSMTHLEHLDLRDASKSLKFAMNISGLMGTSLHQLTENLPHLWLQY